MNNMTRAQELGIVINYGESYKEYDSFGNIVYEEYIGLDDDIRYWTRKEFDSKNRQILYESYDGKKLEYKYDEWGHCVYTKNHRGWGFMCEYDKYANKLWEINFNEKDKIGNRDKILEKLLND